MTQPKKGTREEWLSARKALLKREKVLTRQSDGLARQRRALPWVFVEKVYEFETNEGAKTLADLFDGRSQLLVYHFMLGQTPRMVARAAHSLRMVSMARSPTWNITM